MRQLALLDKNNYDENWPVVERVAVRAIIYKDGKVALLYGDKFGDYKLPGGGVEKGEALFDALAREVREETGLKVIRNTIEEYGETLELRRGRFGDEIYRHRSLYYLCDVGEEREEPSPEPYEINFGYSLAYKTPDEIIENNRAIAEPPSWTERDTLVLELFRNSVKEGVEKRE